MRENGGLLEDRVLDGYRLIRRIGQGGFGEVWLSESTSMGGWHALKFIREMDSGQIEKEFQALALYRKKASRLRSPSLISIEHANRIPGEGLFYVMPLADGGDPRPPADPDWRPRTLATIIAARAAAGGPWFSSQEIIALILPVLDALQMMAGVGLVHRDVKPDNILFFNGTPCLGDIGLMVRDTHQSTARGTPGFSCPSWYQGGHPDMYAVAVTLYALLTGNRPDRMGRQSFLWPPGGEASLSRAEQREWLRLHGVIRRATEEMVAERFVDYAAMAKAVESAGRNPRPYRPSPSFVAIIMFILLVAGAGYSAIRTFHPDWLSSGAAGGEGTTRGPGPGGLAVSDTANKLAMALGLVLSENATLMLDEETITGEQHRLCQTAWEGICNDLIGSYTANIPAALRKYEKTMDAVPQVATRPDARLCLWALRKHSGVSGDWSREAGDPSLVEITAEPAKDDIRARVTLLGLLDRPDAASKYVETCVASDLLAVDLKAHALMADAELEAGMKQYKEAARDIRRALELVRSSPAKVAALKITLEKLTDKHPSLLEHLDEG